MYWHTQENITNTQFLNFPFVCQKIYAYLKLKRPWMATAYRRLHQRWQTKGGLTFVYFLPWVFARLD